MKKSILIAALGLFSLSAMAQDAKPEEGFVFTTVKENPITSIKNQNRSSTCWSFSALGFRNQNYYVWVKVNTTFRKCSLYTKQWKTAEQTMYAIMATVLSLPAEVSMTSSIV